jgi:hypothetical protein
MDICNGFKDWLGCLKCPHLCSKTCPLENDNVIEEMSRHMRLLKASQPAIRTMRDKETDKA